MQFVIASGREGNLARSALRRRQIEIAASPFRRLAMTRLDGVRGRNTPCPLTVTTFHETNLTDAWFKDGLPLTPTPLPRGARAPLPLSRFAGEGWGEGGPTPSHLVVLRRRPLSDFSNVIRFMANEQYRPRRYRQLAMTAFVGDRATRQIGCGFPHGHG